MTPAASIPSPPRFISLSTRSIASLTSGKSRFTTGAPRTAASTSLTSGGADTFFGSRAAKQPCQRRVVKRESRINLTQRSQQPGSAAMRRQRERPKP